MNINYCVCAVFECMFMCVCVCGVILILIVSGDWQRKPSGSIEARLKSHSEHAYMLTAEDVEGAKDVFLSKI